jgi:peptide/nickel transport system ATP-binding protein
MGQIMNDNDVAAAEVAPATALLELKAVSKRFVKTLDSAVRIANLFGAGMQQEVVHAVDEVSLRIERGEVIGLVGESGCGKSTLGRMVVGLHGLSGGARYWKGEQLEQLDIAARRKKQLAIQMIFQDPYASLNPCMRVQDIVGEAPLVHGMVDAAQQREYVESLLQRVGLDGVMLRRFPHQFSGGQRARVGIARALAVNPEFLVCDEAVAALDVSIQAQVLNLFIKLRDELDLTYLFISHDLGVVRHLSDRVVIMYLGRIVESASTDTVFSRANHPYTRALLASAPTLAVRRTEFFAVKGEIPSPLHPPGGCHFHPRCQHAIARCKVEKPELKEISPKHFSACHLNHMAGA